MLKFSTGLRNGLLATGSLRTQLAAGEIRIYSGPVPTSADNAIDVSNVLLVTIKAEGSPLNFETAAANGVITKELDEVWNGVAVASGTATFFRHVLPSDTGALSTTSPRIQGEIAVAGKDMNITSTAISSGGTQTIDYYSVAMLEQQ